MDARALTRKAVEEALACEESGCHDGECAHHGVLASVARALLGPTKAWWCERCGSVFLSHDGPPHDLHHKRRCIGTIHPLVAGLEAADANS